MYINCRKFNTKKISIVIIILVSIVLTFLLNVSILMDYLTRKEYIMFLDTDSSFKNVVITSRQACAIESAALTNPDAQVKLFFTNHTRFKYLNKSDVVKALLKYQNVDILSTNLEELAKSTPLEEFIKSDKLKESKYLVEHTSDAARLLLLWNFGGTYLDTDMIVQKSLKNYPENFACDQDEDEINGAILRLSDERGNRICERLMKELVTNFNGSDFASNGPVLITSFFMELCNAESIEEIVKKGSCEGFHLLETKLCYEVPYYDYDQLFNQDYTDEVMKRTKNSIVVHFWNFMSRLTKLETSSNAAYIVKAKQFCPAVFKASGNFF